MENAVISLLSARHATRAISAEAIPDDVVAELIEAARLAPSCFNNQPWRYLFLRGGEALAKGREALAEGNRAWADRAPLLVVGYSRAEDDCQIPDGRNYHQFDLGLSAMNLMLSATAHDLVARPMAGFSPVKLRQAFDLADDEEPLVMIAVGRPSDDESHLPERYRGLGDEPRERKPADEIVKML